MSEMIKNGLVPNLEHSVAIDYGFERVRAECAERHGEKAKCRGNANKYNHFLCYLQRPFIPAKVLIQFVHFGIGKRQKTAALQKLAHVRRGLAIRERFLECADPSALWKQIPVTRHMRKRESRPGSSEPPTVD